MKREVLPGLNGFPVERSVTSPFSESHLYNPLKDPTSHFPGSVSSNTVIPIGLTGGVLSDCKRTGEEEKMLSVLMKPSDVDSSH